MCRSRPHDGRQWVVGRKPERPIIPTSQQAGSSTRQLEHEWASDSCCRRTSIETDAILTGRIRAKLPIRGRSYATAVHLHPTARAGRRCTADIAERRVVNRRQGCAAGGREPHGGDGNPAGAGPGRHGEQRAARERQQAEPHVCLQQPGLGLKALATLARSVRATSAATGVA
jgi:hypothetical protein